ncbi:MAG: MBL fold metallo-hydrolase [Pseudomonadota bacterium]
MAEAEGCHAALHQTPTTHIRETQMTRSTDVSECAGRSTRREMLQIGGGLALAAGFQGTTASAQTNATTFTVQSYASDPKDVDAVNTHWFETSEGIVVIDCQRLLPEAKHVLGLVQRLGRPIAAIVITHAHSDHYGGLPVFRSAAPDAPVYAVETTLRTIRDDTHGFTAARRRRHGDRFPTPETVAANAPTHVVSHGDRLEIGGIAMDVIVLSAGEADATAMLHLPEHGVIFPGDFVQNTKIPVPFHSLETWLAQLAAVDAALSGDTLAYQGHGVPAPLGAQIGEMRVYLELARDLVRDGLGEADVLSDHDASAIAEALVERFPFHVAGGGATRDRALAGVIARIAAQQMRGDTAALPFIG